MPPDSQPPVVVVGAGVAGLACALDLTAADVPVQILDASDGVGGRMSTDRQGGFLLDRGFQVFNTSYPQVKRRINLRALQLRPFTPGVLLHTGDRRLRFADPTRQLTSAADLLRGRLAGPSDAIALARLCAADMLLPVSLIKRQPDRATFAALTEAGISPALCELLFRPFLAGHIPPEWFLIRDDHLSEVRGLLERLGFTIGDSLDPPPLGAVQNPAKDSPAVIIRIRSDPKRRRGP